MSMMLVVAAPWGSGALAPSDLDTSASALASVATAVTIGTASSYWSDIPSEPSSYSVAFGSKLRFQYNSNHNVWLLPSKADYEACDFSGGTQLSSKSAGGSSGQAPNLYEAVVTAAGTLYAVCEVGGHCKAGQKVVISVAEAGPPAAPPEPSTPLPGPSTPPAVGATTPPPATPSLDEQSAAAGGWATPASWALAIAAAVALRSRWL